MELHRFSRLVFDLHNASRALMAERFQEWAIDRLRRDLPFSSALWGVGMLDDGRESILHNYRFGLRPTFIDDYDAIRGYDKVRERAVETLGLTILDTGGSGDSAPMRRFDARHGVHSVLATGVPDASGSLVQFISLYRADSTAPFTESERALKEALTPHLMQAWRNNWDGVIPAASEPTALLASDGRVIDMDRRFAAMLRAAWPDWCGRRIVLGNEGGAGFDGPRAAMAKVSIVTQPGSAPGTQRVLIRASRCGVLARRERAVAEQYGLGLSYKEIAQLLGITPATVRSYLKTCYDKLGVSNKVQLQQALGSDGA